MKLMWWLVLLFFLNLIGVSLKLVRDLGLGSCLIRLFSLVLLLKVVLVFGF